MIRVHKKTRQRLLLITSNNLVSTLFVLDENDRKIKDGYNAKGEPCYKLIISLNENLTS